MYDRRRSLPPTRATGVWIENHAPRLRQLSTSNQVSLHQRMKSDRQAFSAVARNSQDYQNNHALILRRSTHGFYAPVTLNPSQRAHDNTSKHLEKTLRPYQWVQGGYTPTAPQSQSHNFQTPTSRRQSQRSYVPTPQRIPNGQRSRVVQNMPDGSFPQNSTPKRRSQSQPWPNPSGMKHTASPYIQTPQLQTPVALSAAAYKSTTPKRFNSQAPSEPREFTMAPFGASAARSPIRSARQAAQTSKPRTSSGTPQMRRTPQTPKHAFNQTPVAKHSRRSALLPNATRQYTPIRSSTNTPNPSEKGWNISDGNKTPKKVPKLKELGYEKKYVIHSNGATVPILVPSEYSPGYLKSGAQATLVPVYKIHTKEPGTMSNRGKQFARHPASYRQGDQGGGQDRMPGEGNEPADEEHPSPVCEPEDELAEVREECSCYEGQPPINLEEKTEEDMLPVICEKLQKSDQEGGDQEECFEVSEDAICKADDDPTEKFKPCGKFYDNTYTAFTIGNPNQNAQDQSIMECHKLYWKKFRERKAEMMSNWKQNEMWKDTMRLAKEFGSTLKEQNDIVNRFRKLPCKMNDMDGQKVAVEQQIQNQDDGPCVELRQQLPNEWSTCRAIERSAERTDDLNPQCPPEYWHLNPPEEAKAGCFVEGRCPPGYLYKKEEFDQINKDKECPPTEILVQQYGGQEQAWQSATPTRRALMAAGQDLNLTTESAQTTNRLDNTEETNNEDVPVAKPSRARKEGKVSSEEDRMELHPGQEGGKGDTDDTDDTDCTDTTSDEACEAEGANNGCADKTCKKETSCERLERLDKEYEKKVFECKRQLAEQEKKEQEEREELLRAEHERQEEDERERMEQRQRDERDRREKELRQRKDQRDKEEREEQERQMQEEQDERAREDREKRRRQQQKDQEKRRREEARKKEEEYYQEREEDEKQRKEEEERRKIREEKAKAAEKKGEPAKQPPPAGPMVPVPLPGQPQPARAGFYPYAHHNAPPRPVVLAQIPRVIPGTVPGLVPAVVPAVVPGATPVVTYPAPPYVTYPAPMRMPLSTPLASPPVVQPPLRAPQPLAQPAPRSSQPPQNRPTTSANNPQNTRSS
ncbi:unnamed protein product [Cyprideis torosa]|uniref:Uncharacterized protein n=1 Tax=Cyprideis torosa TaxID=163714 RepID=A0A7R8W5W7_9CRUS|nr:unnamed protein product [Cyprideis torosa]CAG0883376.1 unnamed protein product [Cyprideis torosa]